MPSAVANIIFPGLKRNHPLELTIFRALKDKEVISDEEKFGKAFIALRDIVENLGLQKECIEIVNSKSSVKIVFKKAELKKVVDRKIEVKIFEIDIDADKKKDKVTVKHGSGMYSTPTSSTIKTAEEKRGDFTFKEIRDSFVAFYEKNREAILQWERELLQAEYDSIHSGDLPEYLTTTILENLPQGDIPSLGSLAYLQANAALARVKKIVDRTKKVEALPLEGDNVLETTRLELDLKDRTPEDWFKLLLEKKAREAIKLQEKPSTDKPLEPGAKKKEEIKIPDITPILNRDKVSGSKKFFLPSVLASYQKDLNLFFEKLNMGISATFHSKDGLASIVLFESNYKGHLEERPQITFRVYQSVNREGIVLSKIKTTSKNLARIKELTTINGAANGNGSGNGTHKIDVNGIHIIEERPIMGTLDVSQIDAFIFKTAQIFVNAVKGEKDDKVTVKVEQKLPVELAPTGSKVDEEYIPAS